MYVRKFEADTLEEALKAIKKEMGPDAIILKTVNNKGIKGAFKKKKIEITAAISETNYVKKARVDAVLNTDQKEEFYSDNAGSIKKTIEGHSKNVTNNGPLNVSDQYSKLGLNRPVQTTQTKDISRGLDAFLGDTAEKPSDIAQKSSPVISSEVELDDDLESELAKYSSDSYGALGGLDTFIDEPARQESSDFEAITTEMSGEAVTKIEELEKQIFELKKSVDSFERKEPTGVYQLRTTLRSLDISEKYLQFLIRKTAFDLSDEERQNSDIVFEYALREMIEMIKTDLPLFSKVDEEETPVITTLVSEISSGQTSMLLKLGALKDDAVLIQKSDKNQGENVDFFEKIFGLKVVQVDTSAEVVAECRKAHQQGKSTIIDYRTKKEEIDETKKFIEGLSRSFSNVEVLVSLSAIHSELYNKKVVSLYKGLADGVVVSHLDLCLNFGALFNLAESFQDTPFKFFGTGKIVPDDLEAATAERILAGIFHL
ncbi:MAG: hypothetical protein KAG61_13125 [Bacteriovoracaceae bacterium]|nr:hypothetical protein [Bacteriovoracaceae bacterium]